MMDVVLSMFFDDQRLLLVKPRRRPTYQLVGGKVEDGETSIEAMIREAHEELGNDAIFYDDLFEKVMEFDEIASSDGVTPIHVYLFKYNGKLEGNFSISEEIESFLWYDSSGGDDMLSNTLRHVVIPYCIKNKFIK